MRMWMDVPVSGIRILNIMSLLRWQWLFSTVQRHLDENHPDWQSRAERGLVPVQWVIRGGELYVQLLTEMCKQFHPMSPVSKHRHRGSPRPCKHWGAPMLQSDNVWMSCQSFASTLQSPHSLSFILEKIKFGEDDGMQSAAFVFSQRYEMIFKWLHQQLYLYWHCPLFPAHIFTYGSS